MSWTTSMRNRLGYLVILLTAVAVLFAGLLSPKHNWDMVAYVASSYAADGYRGQDLLDRTYADVRGQVDRSAYRDLTAGPYRATVARDPAALAQQLPFYTIRVGYISIVRAVGRLTGSYTGASHLVAAVFAALSALAMGAVLIRAGVSPLVLPLLVLPIGTIYVARLATPDSMACFASLLLVLALFRPGWWTYVLLAILPAIRSDYIIFSALAAIVLFIVHDRARAVVAVAAAVALYLLLGWWSGNYGYLNLLNFTLFGQRPFPAQLPISTDVRAYAVAIGTNIYYLLSDAIFLLYVVALALLWRQRSMWRDRYSMVLVLLPMTFASAHFALFPSYDLRFLVSSFFLVMVGILRVVTHTQKPAATASGDAVTRIAP